MLCGVGFLVAQVLKHDPEVTFLVGLLVTGP